MSGLEDLNEETVRSLLAHLYDNSYLSQYPLLPLLVRKGLPDPVGRAQQLRSIIVDAILSLQPAACSPPEEREMRPYRVLVYRYLDGLTDEEIRRKLAISERQFFRELKRGVAMLTAILRDRLQEAPDLEEEALLASLKGLGVKFERLHLSELLHEVLPVLEPLCQELGKEVTLRFPEEPSEPLAVADPALSRQALILCLSHALRWAAGSVAVKRTQGPHTEALVLCFRPVEGAVEGPRNTLSLAQQLLEQQGGFLQRAEGDESLICLHWPRFESPAILVVEDDPGMLRLFGRYLEGHGYRVIGLMDGSQAVRFARENNVRLIVLDIMMRSMDGWAVLQRLKTDPGTQGIPVLVCSVIDEPGLARTLGAVALLKKPVTGEKLLSAVAAVLGV